MDISGISTLAFLEEKNIDVEAELQAIESDVNGTFLLVFYDNFSLISKVFYGAGLKLCFEEYQRKTDGVPADYEEFDHEKSSDAISNMPLRAEMALFEPQIKGLRGDDLYNFSNCRTDLYQLFCFGYFKANLLIEGNTSEAEEMYRKCCVYVHRHLCKDSLCVWTQEILEEIKTDLFYCESVVGMLKSFGVGIPDALSARITIMKKVIQDRTIEPLCKPLSFDDFTNMIGIERRKATQEELDEI